MRFIISIFIILSSSETFAQNWAKVSNNKFSYQIERVLYDSIHNKLIVSSKFMNHIGSLNARGVVSWNGSVWDSLKGGINTHTQNFQPYPGGLLTAGTSYNGKWLVGGIFSSIGNVNTTGLALWDGIKWDSLPVRAFKLNQYAAISGFLKKGNLLYIHGDFDSIANSSAQGLATWDGLNFNPIQLPALSGFQGIASIVEYHNELYITGGIFDIGSQHSRDVLKFNGSSWISTTNGGFRGGFLGVSDLIIYKNELYACGHFTSADGDPGDNIMKWNGTQWKDIGFGNTPSFISINKMLEYHNKLWVFGSFAKVSNSFTSNVAMYDGINWCGLKDTLDNIIESAVVYNDTIYIAGYFSKANSDSISFLAKLSDANLFNQCINVGTPELLNSHATLVYPNPTTSILNIVDEQNELFNSKIQISNTLGEVIIVKDFSQQINVSNLAEGMYFMEITNKTTKLTAKFIKQ